MHSQSGLSDPSGPTCPSQPYHLARGGPPAPISPMEEPHVTRSPVQLSSPGTSNEREEEKKEEEEEKEEGRATPRASYCTIPLRPTPHPLACLLTGKPSLGVWFLCGQHLPLCAGDPWSFQNNVCSPELTPLPPQQGLPGHCTPQASLLIPQQGHCGGVSTHARQVLDLCWASEHQRPQCAPPGFLVTSIGHSRKPPGWGRGRSSDGDRQFSSQSPHCNRRCFPPVCSTWWWGHPEGPGWETPTPAPTCSLTSCLSLWGSLATCVQQRGNQTVATLSRPAPRSFLQPDGLAKSNRLWRDRCVPDVSREDRRRCGCGQGGLSKVPRSSGGSVCRTESWEAWASQAGPASGEGGGCSHGWARGVPDVRRWCWEPRKQLLFLLHTRIEFRSSRRPRT
uniref:uncharacterized protein LOC114672162 n=1 Tax=Macaca mulatta TaxID=9544 RepID=UPI0010A2A718|nr:uncharacterized protein LOC114672162 [Macaca mulatta]